MNSSCPNGGGPPLNNDISGIGVRVSFYIQTLLLGALSTPFSMFHSKASPSAILCTRSGSLDEIMSAMYTLISTNMAIAVTALILGLKPNPEISLHE